VFVGLSEEQFTALFYWGREVQNCDGADSAAKLLLKATAHILVGKARGPAHNEIPGLRKPGRPKGSKGYSRRVQFPNVLTSRDARILWMWGHAHGYSVISEVFRSVVNTMMATHPDLGPDRVHQPRPECLRAFAAQIKTPPPMRLNDSWDYFKKVWSGQAEKGPLGDL
jgi:hypothetical protein